MAKQDYTTIVLHDHILQIKNGASLNGIQPKLLPFIILTRNVWNTIFQDWMIITSGTDGEHSKDSFHYQGLAFDIRTRHVNPARLETFVYKLRKYTGPYFQIEIEPTHIHFELDERQL